MREDPAILHLETLNKQESSFSAQETRWLDQLHHGYAHAIGEDGSRQTLYLNIDKGSLSTEDSTDTFVVSPENPQDVEYFLKLKQVSWQRQLMQQLIQSVVSADSSYSAEVLASMGLEANPSSLPGVKKKLNQGEETLMQVSDTGEISWKNGYAVRGREIDSDKAVNLWLHQLDQLKEKAQEQPGPLANSVDLLNWFDNQVGQGIISETTDPFSQKVISDYLYESQLSAVALLHPDNPDGYQWMCEMQGYGFSVSVDSQGKYLPKKKTMANFTSRYLQEMLEILEEAPGKRSPDFAEQAIELEAQLLKKGLGKASRTYDFPLPTSPETIDRLHQPSPLFDQEHALVSRTDATSYYDEHIIDVLWPKAELNAQARVKLNLDTVQVQTREPYPKPLTDTLGIVSALNLLSDPEAQPVEAMLSQKLSLFHDKHGNLLELSRVSSDKWQLADSTNKKTIRTLPQRSVQLFKALATRLTSPMVSGRERDWFNQGEATRLQNLLRLTISESVPTPKNSLAHLSNLKLSRLGVEATIRMQEQMYKAVIDLDGPEPKITSLWQEQEVVEEITEMVPTVQTQERGFWFFKTQDQRTEPTPQIRQKTTIVNQPIADMNITKLAQASLEQPVTRANLGVVFEDEVNQSIRDGQIVGWRADYLHQVNAKLVSSTTELDQQYLIIDGDNSVLFFKTNGNWCYTFSNRKNFELADQAQAAEIDRRMNELVPSTDLSGLF